MQVPRIVKVTVNMGVGEAVADKKVMDAATADMAKITGQKPAVTKAKKSVATFKVRDGQAIGCKVTLRGDRMYEFLDRLVSIAIPRIRDFRGISTRSFDGRGNYSLSFGNLTLSDIAHPRYRVARRMIHFHSQAASRLPQHQSTGLAAVRLDRAKVRLWLFVQVSGGWNQIIPLDRVPLRHTRHLQTVLLRGKTQHSGLRVKSRCLA